MIFKDLVSDGVVVTGVKEVIRYSLRYSKPASITIVKIGVVAITKKALD